MIRLTSIASTGLSAIMLLAAAACAAPKVGTPGFDAFQDLPVTATIDSATPAAMYADCFQNRGTFLPFTQFITSPSGATITYKLAAFGDYYEEIVFRPKGNGSTAVIRLSGGYTPKWTRDFERDRLDALKTCAA